MKKPIQTKFGGAILDDEYYVISNGNKENYGKSLHRLVWEDWYGIPIPKGYVIHHLNLDKIDNRIQNLQCVQDSLHKKYHSSHPSKETRKKLSQSKLGENNPNYGKPLSEEQRKILLEWSKQSKSENHRKNISKARNSIGYFNVSKHKDAKCKQGYSWRYSIMVDGKRIEIHRRKLGDLEREVKQRNLKWECIDCNGVLDIV